MSTVDPLGTPEQRAAEAAAAAVVASPAVQAAVDAATVELLGTDAGRTVGDAGTAAYVRGLARNRALVAVNEDPSRPALVLTTFDGAKMGLDNPDTLYRMAPIDPARDYVLRGHRGESCDVSFQVLDAVSGEGTPGSAVGFLDSGALEVADDGTFEVRATAHPQGRPNEIPLEGSAVELIVRDTLGDWRETPMTLSIETDEHRDPWVPASGEAVIERAVELLWSALAVWPEYVGYLTSVEANLLTLPVGTISGLTGQYSSLGHFELLDDECLVIRIATTSARYFGIQLASHHFVSLDYVGVTSSRNHTQLETDDGTYTLVVSATDPGVANWLDTTGLPKGLLFARWQGLRRDGPMPLVPDCERIGLDGVAELQLRPVGPSERERERRERARAHDLRLAGRRAQ